MQLKFTKVKRVNESARIFSQIRFQIWNIISLFHLNGMRIIIISMLPFPVTSTSGNLSRIRRLYNSKKFFTYFIEE